MTTRVSWTAVRGATPDPWHPLARGAIDPYCEDDVTEWCGEMAPLGLVVCSRRKGHSGIHVASATRRVYDSWGDPIPEELRLPEGF